MADAEKQYSKEKILKHPDKIKSFLKGEIAAPIYVRIKPTNSCNHGCYYCSYEPDFGDIRNTVDRGDEIPRGKIIEVLDDFRDLGVKAVTYSGGGEPLMHPDIEEVLEKTIECGIDLSMITNGQKLSGPVTESLKQAKWVRVSADSHNAEIFEQTRKRPKDWFEELRNNISNFADVKNDSCELGINFVVQEKNANHVYDSIKFFRELGADHIKITPRHIPEGFFEYHALFKKDVISQIETARLDFPDFKIHDTYQADFELTESDSRGYSRCWVMQTIPVIGADCNVYFCHDKAYSDGGVLGSIKDRSFRDLWFSDGARETFERFNPKDSCKHHCANDARNILICRTIEEVLSGTEGNPLAIASEVERISRDVGEKGPHDNFI